jgi:hypothetical protein
MSDSRDYYCCIEYSTSDVKKTVKSEKAHLTIKNKNCLWVRGFRGEDENVKVNGRRMAKAHLAFGKVS